MKNTKGIIILVIAILIIAALIVTILFGVFKKETEVVQNPIVTMEVEGYGTVKIELYPDVAPNTVANFVKLVQNGFYDGLTFHRIISDFMIQGGDINGDGTGSVMISDLTGDTTNDYKYAIKGEFLANGFTNKLKHTKGVISMARSDYSSLGLTEQGYNSAGSQFFIMTSDNSSLNGYYAAFGKVIEGYEIVEKIAATEVKAADEENNIAEGTPVTAPVITKMTVDTFGVDYGTPETVEAFDYTSYINQMYGISGQ